MSEKLIIQKSTTVDNKFVVSNPSLCKTAMYSFGQLTMANINWPITKCTFMYMYFIGISLCIVQCQWPINYIGLSERDIVCQGCYNMNTSLAYNYVYFIVTGLSILTCTSLAYRYICLLSKNLNFTSYSLAYQYEYFIGISLCIILVHWPVNINTSLAYHYVYLLACCNAFYIY